MKRKSIEYFDNSDKFIGELFYDSSITTAKPGILVFPAFEGRSDFALHYAEGFAKRGFVAFAADVYGNAKVASTLDGCFELIGPFLQEGGRSLVRKRALLAYQTFLEQAQVLKNKIGAIGFCFGGMCCLEIARSGADITAIVSMHGLLSKSNLPTHTIHSKILLLHGYKDPKAPPQELNDFAKEMDDANAEDWNFFCFGNAKHSFTDPQVGKMDEEREKAMGREYNPIIAQRAFRLSLDFFNECLGPL